MAIETWYVIMKALNFTDLSCMGIPIIVAEGGPTKYMPVFSTREGAIAWQGSDDGVTAILLDRVEEVKKEEPKVEKPSKPKRKKK